MTATTPQRRSDPAGGKAALLAELSGHREALLQACWAHQIWSTTELRTAEDLPLHVLFPGWLNRGAGPDFTDVRVMIGTSECFGDVEVHMHEGEWVQHAHQRDSAYERVVLHVVLHRSEQVRALRPGSRPIPVFHAAPFLTERVKAVMRDPEEMLRRYESLPGRCGLRAALKGREALNAVIAHAAESRARQKAERLLPLWKEWDDEDILYQLLFQSLGYRPYAEAFMALARRFPLRALNPLLDLRRGEARNVVLARWFGSLGLLDDDAVSSGNAEYRHWRDIWRGLGSTVQQQPIGKRGGRPWNAPERRLVGLFHHVYDMAQRGWLKGWMELLVELDGVRHAAHFRRAAMEALERVFETPQEEGWRRRVSFRTPPLKSAARLIGKERIIVVMANAVIPFFLAYARRRQDVQLEKLLYRLFIVLPSEGPNQKTRFMEKRLMVTAPLPATLRTQQGLLQIHQDFCTSFHEGCGSCHFPDLIHVSGEM